MKKNTVLKISFEEYLDAQEQMVKAPLQIDDTLKDTNRTIDVAQALEELAVVADSIENATQAEANLIEIGGNIAVAGTHIPAERVIPSMEGFIGRSISIEEFKLKEVLDKIWEAIKRAFAAVWDKLREFFKSSDIVLGRSLNKVRELKKTLHDMRGFSPIDERTLFQLKTTSGDKHFISSGIVSILNDTEDFYLGTKPVKPLLDPERIIKKLQVTEALFDTFFTDYSKKLTDIAQSVSSELERINEANIKEKTFQIKESLERDVAALFDTLLKSMQSSTTSAVFATRNLNREHEGQKVYNSPALGSPLFVVDDFTASASGANPKLFFDRLKSSKIQLQLREVKEVDGTTFMENAYKLEDLVDMVDAVDIILKRISDFKDNAFGVKVHEGQKKLEKAGNTLKKSLEKSEDKSLASNVNDLLSFNLAYTNWSRYPLLEMVFYAIRIQRAISWLVTQNLKFFYKAKSQEK